MKKDLKRYKITFDPSDESITGIELISFVKNPAIKRKGIKLSIIKKQFEDDEKMIVIGPALIPDLPIYRYDDETKEEYEVVFDKETIVKLVEKFNRNIRETSLNLDHSDKIAPAYILESWIKEDEIYDKSNKYGFEDVPVGSWFITSKITDRNFWENEVKKNDKFGFSIEGFLDLELEKIEMEIVEGLVASSNVSGYRYNTDKNILVLEFNDGSRYEYRSVSFKRYLDIILGNATCETTGENQFGSWYSGKNPSIGAAVFEYLVKSNIPYTKLEEEIVNIDNTYSRIYKYLVK